jgi:CRISPR-associated helicase Cas3
MLDTDAPLVVLEAGTGTGKTQAALLPIVSKKERALVVYPTKALLRDQRHSIVSMMRERLGERVQEIGSAQPEGEAGGWTVVTIDADCLDERRRARRRRTKGAVLAELLDPAGPRFVLTNPDVLYQILAWRYRSPGHSVAQIAAYPNLILDEFHLYAGIELANVLALIGLGRALRAFGHVTVLSATPDDAVVALIERTVGSPATRIREDAPIPGVSVIGQRAVAHEVRLSGMQVDDGDDLVEKLAAFLSRRRDGLLQLRAARRDDPYFVPAVGIVNSVMDARLVEEQLLRDGWTADEIGPMRGLVGAPARDPRGRLLVLGTSAIEVGVDFSTALLCFQAGDVSSFLQRFGRVGRHCSGVAVLLGDHREIEHLDRLSSAHDGRIDRPGLASFARQVFAGRDAMTWFCETEGAAALLLCLEESILATIRRDSKAVSEQELRRIEATFREIFDGHGRRLGETVRKQLARLRTCFEAARQAPRHAYRYLMDLVSAYPTLRSAVASVRVWDVVEARKRGRAAAVYDVEVTRLAKQGRGVVVKRSRDGSVSVSVGRWERGGDAYLNEFLTPGRFYCAREKPGLLLCNPYGCLPPEVFEGDRQVLFVTDAALRGRLDWRVPVVRCGKDGQTWAAMGWAALLLSEISRRHASVPYPNGSRRLTRATR